MVCPGGGYSMKAQHEGGPIAEYLNDCGLSAFVLDYRVAPYRYPCELLDAKRAIRYVRYNAEKFGIDKDKIGICGFSAGGHLAGMTLTSPEDEASEYNVNDEIDKVSSKVNFCNFVLSCYNKRRIRAQREVLTHSAVMTTKY
ncbi:MAG: alpha/beta hydrolase [Clostridiales bacterium]|nr:MAG: alpha/beta hydrolase [Clostridiales bacterium]